MIAVSHNHDLEVVKALVEAGADINSRDILGANAFFYAARDTKNPDVITYLLEMGADAKILIEEIWTLYEIGRLNENLKNTEALQQLYDACHSE